MWKIKDNVDLKELERFGYKPDIEENPILYTKYYQGERVIINAESRILFYLLGDTDDILDFDYIELDDPYTNYLVKDLIQAGLVEKV